MTTPLHVLRVARALALLGAAVPVAGCLTEARAQAPSRPEPRCPAHGVVRNAPCAHAHQSCEGQSSEREPNMLCVCTAPPPDRGPNRWRCRPDPRAVQGPLAPPELA